MRLILEIAALSLLLYLGWEKPFKSWVHSPPDNPPPPVVATAQIETSPTPAREAKQSPPTPARGSWMWDKKRATVLDHGPYKNGNVSRPTATVTAGQPGYLVDQAGNRYWVDQNGVRHYL